MLLEVKPLKKLESDHFNIPSSKPETQRAIVTSALANGESIIHNDLRCLETSIMKNAFIQAGADIKEEENFLRINGTNKIFGSNNNIYIVDSIGSGLVARLFSVLASASPVPVVVTGDSILRGRIMSPLFQAMIQNKIDIRFLAEENKLPIVNLNSLLPGGKYKLPRDISSQFITAFLMAAPLAQDVTEILIEGELYSASYIRQTIDAMKNSGIAVNHSDDLTYLKVSPGYYSPSTTRITGDFTSASYVLAAAALFNGKTVLHNMSEKSLQGEKAMVDMLRKMGISITFDEDNQELVVQNDTDGLKGNYEFNVMDCPNITPTLAALGSFVEGRFRVVGAALTRLHKAPRVEAMATELKKLGVNITLIHKDGIVDGFEIMGKSSYKGGITFSSWKDHRIFMSLFILSLKTEQPNYVDGFGDVGCSFPDFLKSFTDAGVIHEVKK